MRSPRQLGWRSSISPVHSVKATSPSSRGWAHCAPGPLRAAGAVAGQVGEHDLSEAGAESGRQASVNAGSSAWLTPQRARRSRARRSSSTGPPPGHNAGTPARTPAARHTTGSPGAGTPDHGRPPRTHRPQAGTAIRWPRATPPRIPSRGRRRTGVPGPRDVPPAAAATGTTPGLLLRAGGTLRPPPGSRRSAVQKQEGTEISTCRRR